MLNQSEQERLAGEILRNCYEVMTLEELGSQGLPRLDRLFDTSTSLLYRCNDRGEIIAVAGSLSEASAYYVEHYYSVDPTQRAARRLNPWILHAPSVPEWKEFLQHPVHTDFLTRYGFDNYLHLRLNDYGMHDPGMVGIVLARSARQPDFNEREQMLLAGLLPAMEAATRRCARWEGQFQAQPFVESMLDSGTRPQLALDLRGALLWASERAIALLEPIRRERSPIPDILTKAARRLGALTGKKADSAVPLASVAIPRPNAAPIRAELRLARTRSGACFVIVELEDPEISPLLAELEARYRLTAAETQVLRWIALGLSDRQISRRLFVSAATVHSHVTRILGKLGVGSRVQAALLAHGHPVESDSDETLPNHRK